VPKEKRTKLEASRNKDTFVRYCENSKAYRIYVLGQRNIELTRDVTFDEDVALAEARDTPHPANIERKDDAMDVQEETPMPKSEPNLADDPMEPMDPPPCDPPARKRLLWLHDTLQDAERYVVARRTFKESMKPYRYQGYVVAMSNPIQVELCTFEEAVKEQV